MTGFISMAGTNGVVAGAAVTVAGGGAAVLSACTTVSPDVSLAGFSVVRLRRSGCVAAMFLLAAAAGALLPSADGGCGDGGCAKFGTEKLAAATFGGMKAPLEGEL